MGFLNCLNPARFALTAVTLLTLSTGISFAEEATQEMPSFPEPTQQHAWLQQFVGTWESETESYMKPGQAPEKSKGLEKVQALGGFWITDHYQGTMMGQPFSGVMTIGYDSDKEKYVATWVDSMYGKMWEYEGTVDDSGKKLTLETQGMCPMRPGKITQFKDVIQFTDDNHKTYQSFMMDDTGEWVQMMSSHATRQQ